MSEATRTAILLGAAALVVPLVWGYLAYWILDRLWPRPGTADGATGEATGGVTPRTSPSPRDADFFDFQI